MTSATILIAAVRQLDDTSMLLQQHDAPRELVEAVRTALQLVNVALGEASDREELEQAERFSRAMAAAQQG